MPQHTDARQALLDSVKTDSRQALIDSADSGGGFLRRIGGAVKKAALQNPVIGDVRRAFQGFEAVSNVVSPAVREGIALERAGAERLGISGRAVDPLDLGDRSTILRTLSGEFGPDVGPRRFVTEAQSERARLNFGQNLALDIGSDLFNIVPGLGFTSLSRKALPAVKSAARTVPSPGGAAQPGPRFANAPRPTGAVIDPRQVTIRPTRPDASRVQQAVGDVQPGLRQQILDADDAVARAVATDDFNAISSTMGERNRLTSQVDPDADPATVATRLRGETSQAAEGARVTPTTVDGPPRVTGPTPRLLDKSPGNPILGPDGIRSVAKTPEEVATTRARAIEAPTGQQTNIPPPETVAAPQEAQESIAREFYDAVPDSQTDIAATAYLQTGKIDDYITRIPPSFEVAEGFADEVFKEVGRVSAKMADPTRTIQAIDFGFFGKALQRGLLWPTRRTFLASVNWGDVNKVAFRDILNTRNIRGRNPIRTKQMLNAVGDVLEEVGTNDVLVDAGVLNNQFDKLLKNFDAVERINIVDAAKDTRKFLDDLLDVQNAARAKRGQSEIPKLQNYRPWIRSTNIWSQTGHSDLPAKTISQSPIPPDFIKPNAAFNPRAQQRLGGLEGYEKIRNVERLVLDYVESARKDIFYTNIIQNGKAHIKALRGKELENSAAAIEDWIMESYAGKLPSLSKGIRENIPPPIVKGALALRRSLTRAVFPLNWTWNAFVQTSSAGLTVKNHGVTSTTQGLEYLFRPSSRRWVRENAYSAIIKRRGGGRATLQDVGPGVGSTDAIQRSAVETVESYANFLTNIIEDNLTGVSVRAAFHDGRRRGLTGRALTEFASEGGSKTQSMYNLEDLPGMLRAKEVGALVPFQTFAFEIMNTVREAGVGLGKIGARTQQNRLISLAHWFGAIVAFNIIGETLNNRQPWQLSSFVPFFSVMTAGADPSSTWNRPLPIKYTADLIKGIQDVSSVGSWIKLRSWAIRYHMLGGTQIDRTLKGIEAVADGEVTDRRERNLFDVGDTKFDIFKAVTQGVYSTSEGQEYIDRLNELKGPGSRITGIPTRKFFPIE